MLDAKNKAGNPLAFGVTDVTTDVCATWTVVREARGRVRQKIRKTLKKNKNS